VGEMIQATCESCGYSRKASVGVGMMGIGVELCACYNCQRFVMKRVDYRDMTPSVLKCPYCRKIVKPIKNGNRCATCDGRLSVATIGLWD
jgi:hypothetical protein